LHKVDHIDKRTHFSHHPAWQVALIAAVAAKQLQAPRLLHLRLSTRQVPEAIGQLTALRQLHLNNCRGLTSLPESIGRLSSLQHLDVSGCRQLRSLPDSFVQLSALQHLDLVARWRAPRAALKSERGPKLHGLGASGREAGSNVSEGSGQTSRAVDARRGRASGVCGCIGCISSGRPGYLGKTDCPVPALPAVLGHLTDVPLTDTVPLGCIGGGGVWGAWMHGTGGRERGQKRRVWLPRPWKAVKGARRAPRRGRARGLGRARRQAVASKPLPTGPRSFSPSVGSGAPARYLGANAHAPTFAPHASNV
jgi:hypothetical protein